jgi:hypothetical protein
MHSCGPRIFQATPGGTGEWISIARIALRRSGNVPMRTGPVSVRSQNAAAAMIDDFADGGAAAVDEQA